MLRSCSNTSIISKKSLYTSLNDGNIASLLIVLFLLIIIINASVGQYALAIGENNSSGELPIWYVGKNAKPGLYLKYAIQENSTGNDIKEYDMTLYFRNHDNSSSHWIVPVYVNDHQGKVVNGTFTIEDDFMIATSVSGASASMERYRLAYNSSLDWISGFFAKEEGLRLGSLFDWLGSIDRQTIQRDSDQPYTISIPAGNFSTWSYYLINKSSPEGIYRIWINKDLPYPVKGQGLSSNSPSDYTIYSFELLAYGESRDVPPESVIIPEFGSLAILAITLSMTAAVGVSSKWRARKRN